MAIDAAIPTVVGREMIRTLQHDTVWAARCNTRWQLEAEVGDQVDIVPEPSVTTANYVPNMTELTYGALDPGDAKSIMLNQRKSFAIKLDDVYNRQSRPDVLSAGVRNGSAGLMEVLDGYARDLFTGIANRSIGAIGSTGSKIDLSGDIDVATQRAIKTAFKGAAAAMTTAKIPVEGRWAVFGLAWQFVLTTLFETGQLGDATLQDTVRNGFMGSLYGIRCFLTSNPASVAAVETCVFGNDYAAALIVQMTQMETLRLESAFADAVRGLMVYGGVAVEEAGVFTSALNYENLPAAS